MPLVMTGAAAVPVATSYIQTLKSKSVIVAGTTMGLVGLTAGGKALWKSFCSSEPIRNDDRKSDFLRATDVDTQKLILSGIPKEVFRTYKLISDYSGKLKRTPPRMAMSLGLVRPGSEIYKTNGYLTFSLPPQNKMTDVHQVGVIKKIKKV